MSSRDIRDLCYFTVNEAACLIQKKELSPVELTQAHLQRIDELDGKIKSFVALLSETAMAEARSCEADILKGDYRGPLHGIPVAHKDQFDAQGLPSRARLDADQLQDVIEDATVVRKLKEAGSVFLGKLEMGGWAVGKDASSQRLQARNPWDLTRSPGGSSSGSGAALAAGLCMGSLGEDSGGSIRSPASLCGIVGLKPTYGLLSRRGLATLSWSLDHSGPMARTVEDTALVLQATAGHDPRDPTSINVQLPDYSSAIREDISGVRIGVPRDYIDVLKGDMDGESVAAMNRALLELESLGARVEEVRIPSLELSLITFLVMWYSETFSPRKKTLQSNPEIFGDAARRVCYQGSLIPTTDYLLAQQARTRLRRECAEVFRSVDVLILPTVPSVAPLAEAVPQDASHKRPPDVSYFLSPFNLTGTPAISLPCGFNSNNLPLGMQILGKALDEITVLRVAYTYQQHAGWYKRRPTI